MKSHFVSLFLAIPALLPLQAIAQAPPVEQTSQHLTSAPPAVARPATSEFHSALGAPLTFTPTQSPRELYSDGRGVTVWGNVVYSRAWGDDGEIPAFNAYTYSSENGLKVSTVASDKWMFASGSGAFYDGKFHMVSKGYTTYLYCEYDVASWTVLYQEMSTTKFHKVVATDCDYDPITGLTYGCFWNSDTKEYEFASVDYETCTHNTIAPMEIFSAIAINSKGVVYGIKESDGGLYTIDKTTGRQTFVGSTGVSPYLLQSAAFDRRNDVLYWAVRQTGSVAYLATVNTDNASVKRLAYFPDAEQLMCLYVPWTAEAGAPACPSVFSAEPRSGSNTIDLSFSLPRMSYSGKLLGTGALNYEVTLNGKSVKLGSGKPGEVAKMALSGKEGYNTISVTVSNDAGSSVPLELRRWCGAETPAPVTDVTATIDNNANNKVTLRWKTSGKGIHGGAIGAENITYNIVRQPDNVSVATGLATTVFTEELGNDKAGVYTYSITPVAHGVSGEAVVSPEVLATGIYGVPFHESFDTKATFEKYTVIDSNGDGTKWFWNEELQQAEYLNGWKGGADDWLLMPEISLKAGGLYELSFDCCGFDTYYTELLDIRVGQGDDISTYTEIMPVTEIKTPDMKRLSVVFGVPSDGAWRVAFHCTSGQYAMYILLDNIAVTPGPAPKAPAAASNLAVVPDATGLLSAKVSFDAPALCADGSPLASISKVEVYRGDDILVETIGDVAPGETKEITDSKPTTGINKYTVVVFNDEGSSMGASAEVYVGQDIPWDPAPAKIVDKGSCYAVSWTAPPSYGSSARRGPVIVDELTYNIYGPDKSLMTKGISGLSYEITGMKLEGEQNMQAFYVSAVSPAGEGSMAATNAIIVGKPYTLPFRESFPNGLTPATFWWTDSYNRFQASTDMSYDNDGGCICWKSNRWDKTSWFNSGKIDISLAKEPTFSFAYRTLPGKQFKVQAYVAPDGGDNILLGELDFSTLEGEPTWEKASYSLAPYTDSKYVVVKIYLENAEPYVEGESLLFYVDELSVIDPQGINVAATGIKAPSTVYIGQSAAIGVNITNLGIKTAPFDVKLFVNDNLAGTYRHKGLDAQATETVTFGYVPEISAPETLTVRAEVEYADDKYTDDNATEALTIAVIRPGYATVADLSAREKDGAVELSWTEPEQASGPVHESFEDYVHKDTSIAPWTTVDNDGGLVYSNQLVDIGYYNVQLAYSVFNTLAAGLSEDDLEYYAAHDGTTSLLAIASQPTTILNGDRNDDWLISPELSAAVSHKISFWAKSVKGETYGKETFDIMYSKGFANDLESFVRVKSCTAPQQWTQYTAEIPAGARYFAVRYTGEDLFIFMVDDFEFEIGQMDVEGYNVFRDGKKVATVKGNVTSWRDTDTDLDVPHIYHVTVNYGNGESDFSNACLFDRSGLVDVDAALPAGPFDVYNVAGVCVRRAARNLDGLPQGIYLVGNRKIAVL